MGTRAMSDITNFTGKFRIHRNNLQEPSKVVKRPRDSLVCSNCKRSKLRCDLRQPCSSCVRRNEETTCRYHQDAARKEEGSQGAAEARLNHLEALVQRLIQNQPQVATKPQPVTPPNTLDDAARDDSIDETVEQSQYWGSTHWSAVLDDIHDLKDILANSEYAGRLCPSEESEIIFGASTGYSIHRILSEVLPERKKIDRLLSIYFQGETFVIPFVHVYHFQEQYRRFWDDPSNVNPLWLSILFSICYLASMIRSLPNDAASQHDLHTAAAQCLVLGKYHLPQEFAVEALSIYAHCNNMRDLDPSRSAGVILAMAVRTAIHLGYHRDPDSFGGKLTVFEGEMRRRSWAVIKQMDLMTSFMLGLPSTIYLESSDTRSPRNLLDSDFDADTTELPPSRSEAEASRLLWFIIKDKQMIAFSKVCRDALAHTAKSEAEILDMDQQIRKMQNTVPEVLRMRPLAESMAESPFIIMVRLYVEFIYLKSICVLHRRYLTRISSAECCSHAGKKLVSQFIEIYRELSPGGQLHSERWMLTNYTWNDFLLGVTVLCLLHSRGASDPEITTLLEQSHAICVENSNISRDARRVAHAVSLLLTSAADEPSWNVGDFQDIDWSMFLDYQG